MDAAHELLLSKVGRFYERHNAARQGRTHFNVFTVLRSSSDEVNLHSRFLHAVLDHRATPTGERKNLRDFVTDIACVEDFRLEGAKVGRETHNIDLLIDNHPQAIVIENKIYAGDQEQQLQRYKQKLVELGYDPSDIHLLYLTPLGTPPSEQSIGNLECKTVSYRYDLPPWLKRCQRRAFDDPALRESIAQYLHLIRAITGADYSEEYMVDLKKLCLKDDNLLLTHDLSQAFVDAKADLVVCLWSELDRALSAIDDFPELDPEWVDRKEFSAVKDCINNKQRSWSGLCYRMTEGAGLTVVADSRLWFGVSCNRDTYPKQHEKLRVTLSEVAGKYGYSSSTPWYRYPSDLDLRNLNHDNLRMLMSETARPQFAKDLAVQIVNLWQQARRASNLEPT